MSQRLKPILLMVIFTLLLSIAQTPKIAAQTDLDAIKTYLLDNLTLLQTSTADLKQAALDYYTLAEASDFDYAALWNDQPESVTTALFAARDAWLAASPLYEQVEGIVAGVPSLADYDVILDAGASGEDDPDNGVQFDLTLRDGRIIERPGNLFGVLESTLWGTRPDYSSSIEADFDADGEPEFSELLPDADVLLASAETMDGYVAELMTAAEAWTPSITDSFTALVVMVPTMSEYFAAWRDSRFVLGDASTQTDFVVISRLADIEDILDGLIVVYDGVSPLVVDVDASQDQQIHDGLLDLKDYVHNLYTQEQDGRIFTPEEADFFGSEAQRRAEAITGYIAQVAALLDVQLPQ